MASIKYLENVDLGKNEIQNARVQNLASAPSTPVEGQIYWNTADDTLYVYDADGTAWLDCTATGGSVDVLSNFSQDRIAGRIAGGEGNSEELTQAQMITFLGIETAATADQTNAEIRAAVEAATDSNVFNDADHTNLNNQSNSNTGDEPAASTTVIGVSELAIASEVDTGTSVILAVTPAAIEGSARSTKLDLIEAVADVTDNTNVNAAGATMNADTTMAGNGYFLDQDTMSGNDATKVSSQQAIVAYVAAEIASAITTGMDYKGAYNAATNTPDLDTSPIAADIGDVYAVTVAGTFFATALEVGDILIANQGTPTAEAHWDVVQADLDAASIKTLYESNSDTNEFSDAEQTSLGTMEDNATADQSDAEIRAAVEAATDSNVFNDADHTNLNNQSGTNTNDEVPATTSVAGVAEIAIGTEIATGTDAGRVISPDELQAVTDWSNMAWFLDQDDLSGDDATKVASQQSIKAYIDGLTYLETFGGNVAETITHSLGTKDVTVEVYVVATNETVLCDVVRTSTSVVTLNFAVAPSASSLRVIVRA